MSTQIVGSDFPEFASEQLAPAPSKPGYGQNQFNGAASDLPGQNTRSGFLPGTTTPVNNQLRKIKADALPTTFGMKSPKKT